MKNIITSILLIVLSCISFQGYTEESFTSNDESLLGISVHLWGLNKANIDKQIQAAKLAGFKVIRWDAPWKAVEVEKDQLRIPENWNYIVSRANAVGIQSLLILDYGNKYYDNGDKPLSSTAIKAYARYATFVANHFKGQVKYYEIWNEWNGKVGNTTPGRLNDYVKLLKETYPAIKNVDKNNVVLGGSFTTGGNDSLLGLSISDKEYQTHMEAFLKTDISNYLDAIALHPYVTERKAEWRSQSGFSRLLSTVVNKIKSTPGLESKPIYITEIGWHTSKLHKNGVSESEQADYLEQSINESKRLGVSMVIIYELIDGGTNQSDKENNFGLLRNDGSEKLSFQRMKKVNN